MWLSILAAIAVAVDLWISLNWYLTWPHVTLVLLVIAVYRLCGFDSASMGLRVTPLQPIRYWIRITALIAFAMFVVILACLGLAIALHVEFTTPTIPPWRVGPMFKHMCLRAPLLEEPIFRLALCVPMVAAFGPTRTIIINGIVFATAHFLWGNPGPDNFIAGYFLAWAYLKSGSLLVPVTLHFLGNLVAFAAQVAAWHYA